MKKSIVTMCVVLAGVGMVHASLINGGFEDPAMVVGSADTPMDIDTDASAITGWTMFGAAAGNKIGLYSPNWDFWGALPGLTDGQYLGFNAAEGGFGDAIEQSITTAIGDTITVSYDVGVGNFGDLSGAMRLDATSAGGALGDMVSQVSTHGTVSGFTTYTAQFVATTATTTLRFTDVSVGSTSGADTLLDNVSAIPEPATLGMVAVFGGGILFIRRKLMM